MARARARACQIGFLARARARPCLPREIVKARRHPIDPDGVDANSAIAGFAGQVGRQSQKRADVGCALGHRKFLGCDLFVGLSHEDWLDIAEVSRHLIRRFLNRGSVILRQSIGEHDASDQRRHPRPVQSNSRRLFGFGNVCIPAAGLYYQLLFPSGSKKIPRRAAK